MNKAERKAYNKAYNLAHKAELAEKWKAYKKKNWLKIKARRCGVTL